MPLDPNQMFNLNQVKQAFDAKVQRELTEINAMIASGDYSAAEDKFDQMMVYTNKSQDLITFLNWVLS